MFGKRSSGQLPPVKRVGPAPQALPPAAGSKEAPKPMAQSQAPKPAANGPSSRPSPAEQSGKGRPDVPAQRTAEPAKPKPVERKHSEEYYDIKTTVFNALIDTIDLTQLAKLDADAAREEIRDIVSEIIQVKNVVMSIAEQEELLEDICNDVLGYGPLEPLLARDDIADIMVNGAGTTFIEVGGKVEKTNIRFADNAQLMNICQRIVSQVGRRVDESSPICDARLPDGSRVNVIAPPLAIDGPALTIRKFKKDKLTLEQLMKFGSISPEAKTILEIIGRVRCNIIISGGTGSGKTTLLNCLTGSIDMEERIITCEDSAELQLQQPHVVRLETRPPNLEGEGQITMRDLVKNCLRMRPERIIVGEVRGPEAFDLLQAMNTGHDGSMGTLHSNSPREAISRMESMIMMGGFSLPSKTIREMITGSVDVIVQASRLRDGSRRITHITEVLGMEGDVVTLQNIIVYDITGEDANGKIIGRHRSTGIARPRFWERASYYGEEGRLATALASAEVRDVDGSPLGETNA
jgi:pilus assembly protein CpaF